MLILITLIVIDSLLLIAFYSGRLATVLFCNISVSSFAMISSSVDWTGLLCICRQAYDHKKVLDNLVKQSMEASAMMNSTDPALAADGIFCCMCSVPLTSTRALRTHICVRHLALKRAVCHLCGERFTWPSQLQTHRFRVHCTTATDLKNYKNP